MVGKIRVKLILGSTRQGRFGEKPANWLYNEIKRDWSDSIDIELLDLRDYQMPFFDDPIPPSQHKGEYKNQAVGKWAEKIRESDAFIIVTPEYNHGYPGALKNAMDWIYKEWNNKPVGFVSYGSALGARAIEQMRSVAVALQMAPIRNALHIPSDVYANASAASDQAAVASAFGPIRKGPMGDRVAGFMDQLLWWAMALKSAREGSSQAN